MNSYHPRLLLGVPYRVVGVQHALTARSGPIVAAAGDTSYLPCGRPQDFRDARVIWNVSQMAPLVAWSTAAWQVSPK